MHDNLDDNNEPHTNREFRRYQAWYQRATRCRLRLQWTKADYADIESSDDEDTAYDQSTRAGRQVEAGPIFDRVVSQLPYFCTLSCITIHQAFLDQHQELSIIVSATFESYNPYNTLDSCTKKTKPIAICSEVLLLRTLLRGNTLKCSVEEIERIRPRVRDDYMLSFLDVRLKIFFQTYH